MKTYLDYANQYLSGQGSLEEQNAYKRNEIKAMYLKFANDETRKMALENAKKEKQKSLSESAIAQERARAYVDAMNKHLGIAGTGYAADKAIDLYVQEANRRAEINENYQNKVNEINKSTLENELDFAKQYNSALDLKDETLDNNKNLVIDYLFSVLSEDELNNLPYVIYNDEYFQKLFEKNFIK